MQRRMSHQVLGVLFLAAVAIALLPAGSSTAADNEVVVAVWTSPEAENLKRAARHRPEDGPPRRDRRDRARRLPAQGEHHAAVEGAGVGRGLASGRVGAGVREGGAMIPVDTMFTKEQLAELRGLDTSTFEGKLWGRRRSITRSTSGTGRACSRPRAWKCPRPGTTTSRRSGSCRRSTPREGRALRDGPADGGAGGERRHRVRHVLPGVRRHVAGRQQPPGHEQPAGDRRAQVLRRHPPDREAGAARFRRDRLSREEPVSAGGAGGDGGPVVGRVRPLTSCEKSPKICKDIAATVVPGRRDGSTVKRAPSRARRAGSSRRAPRGRTPPRPS